MIFAAQYAHEEQTTPRVASPAAARGFTFLEFTVALVVLGVALAGLFPLLAITSRGLQPIKTTSTFRLPNALQRLGNRRL